MTTNYRYDSWQQPGVSDLSVVTSGPSGIWDMTPAPQSQYQRDSFDATLRAPVSRYPAMRTTPKRILAPSGDPTHTQFGRYLGQDDESLTTEPVPSIPRSLVEPPLPTVSNGVMTANHWSSGVPQGLFGRTTFEDQTPSGRMLGRKRPRAADSTREEIERQLRTDDSRIASAGKWFLSALSKLPIVGSLISPTTSTDTCSPPEGTKENIASVESVAKSSPQSARPQSGASELTIPRLTEPVEEVHVDRSTYEQARDLDHELEYIMKLRREHKLDIMHPFDTLLEDHPYSESSKRPRITEIEVNGVRYDLCDKSTSWNPFTKKTGGVKWDPFKALYETTFHPPDERVKTLPIEVVPKSFFTESCKTNPFVCKDWSSVHEKLRRKKRLLKKSPEFHMAHRYLSHWRPFKWIDYYDYLEAKKYEEEERRRYTASKPFVREAAGKISTKKADLSIRNAPVVPKPLDHRSSGNMSRPTRRGEVVVELSEESQPTTPLKGTESKPVSIHRFSSIESVSEKPNETSSENPSETSTLRKRKLEDKGQKSMPKPSTEAVESVTKECKTVSKEVAKEIESVKANVSPAATVPWWLANVGNPTEVTVEDGQVFADNALEDEPKTTNPYSEGTKNKGKTGEPSQTLAEELPSTQSSVFSFSGSTSKPEAAFVFGTGSEAVTSTTIVSPKPFEFLSSTSVFDSSSSSALTSSSFTFGKCATPTVLEKPKPVSSSVETSIIEESKSTFGSLSSSLPSEDKKATEAQRYSNESLNTKAISHSAVETPSISINSPSISINPPSISINPPSISINPPSPDTSSALPSLFGLKALPSPENPTGFSDSFAAATAISRLDKVSTDSFVSPEKLNSLERQPAVRSQMKPGEGSFSMQEKHSQGANLMDQSKVTEEADSIFGRAKPAGVPKSLFGSATSTSGPISLFGQAAKSAEGPTRLFGQAAKSAEGPTSLFGQAEKSAEGPTSLFGQAAKPAEGPTSLFGQSAKPAEGTISLFGQSAKPADGAGSLFGQAAKPAEGVGNLFGQTKPWEGTTSLFGQAKPAESVTSLFGQTKPTEGSGSLFGQSAKSAEGRTSLFGEIKPAEGTTSLFGQEKPATSGNEMFGQLATSITGSNLFGSVAASSTSGSTFFNTASTTGSSLFGPASNTGIQGGLFGQSSNAVATPSGLFGQSSRVQGMETSSETNIFSAKPTDSASVPTGGGLFGSTNKETGLFGQSLITPSVFGGNSPTSSGLGFGQQQPSLNSSGSLFNSQQSDSSNTSAFGIFGPTTSSQDGPNPFAGNLTGLAQGKRRPIIRLKRSGGPH